MWAFIIVVVCLVYRELIMDTSEEKNDTLYRWLKENKLSFLTEKLKDEGVNSIAEFLSVDLEEILQSNQLNSKEKWFFTKKFKAIKMANNNLISWLKSNGLEKYINGFYKLGYTNIESVKERMDKAEVNKIIASFEGSLAEYELLIQALMELKENSDGWIVVQVILFVFQIFMFLSKWILRLLLFACIYFLVRHGTLQRYYIAHTQSHQLSFLCYLLGNFLDPSSCHVDWLWNGKIPVGQTMKFVLKLCKRNPFLTHVITGKENILIEVRNNEANEEITTERDSAAGKNALCVSFHPKKAGRYTISVLVDGKNIAGSPFVKTFLPGPVDPSKISIFSGISTVVVTKGVYYPLKVETRDKYNNLCELENQDFFKVHAKKVGSDTKTFDPELIILPDSEGTSNMLHIKVEEEGCFHSHVTYKGQSITSGSFVIISLCESDAQLVCKATARNSWNQTWYEAFVLPTDYQKLPENDEEMSDPISFLRRCRKVYCYFSARQVTIKEFYLKIIPYRLYSFRISPSSKIVFPQREDCNLNYPGFILDDGIQPPVSFMSPKRSLIAATFARLLLRNIGGAESFKEKVIFFYRALQSHHGRDKSVNDKKIDLKIDRKNILESSFEATKNWSTSKWTRRFYVKFEDEEGYDAGGLTREWISLVSTSLFDPTNQMFTQFNKDDKQSLIHPNPSRPSRLKLKYYEFAGRIVGKCIFESSCSAIRRLNVRARFTRSFLAQLIGLRVNYKYFKTDDKQLYSSKIKYIQDVDPEDLNLFFSEEEYDSNQRLIKEVELIPNGRNIMVTQQNKMQYLDSLAQYRLRTRVSGEIDAFLKGLNELVPDNLLTMFSEQELELLICGTSDISINDLKKHHKLFAQDSSFTKVMNWFWKTVALFSQEEIARLLQFTTGSSQLPPGGFAQLTPKFSFMSSSQLNVLPRAHTCFNQLVLPDYSSYEEFQRCLHLAITEGCEGFGFE